MDQFDIFESLGVTAPESTKKKKPAGKDKKPKGQAYALPLTLYTGYHEPATLEGSGKNELGKQELEEKIAATFPEYKGCLYRAGKKGGCIYAYFSPDAMATGGSLEISPSTKMVLGNTCFDLSALPLGESREASTQELSRIVTEKIPLLEGAKLGFYHIQGPDIIIPKLPETGIPDGASFPVTALLPERGILEITKELYEDAGGSPGAPDEKGLAKAIVRNWPELAEGFSIYFAKNVAILSPNFAPADPPTPQGELIPVDGTVISLVFAKIALSPEMFGGAEEVPKDDIIHLLSKEYPEYSKTRTEIIYDAQKRLIIPVLKGSRKGAGLIPFLDDPVQMQLFEQEFRPYYKEYKGQKVRVENTPFARFQKNGDAVSFQYHLPKIPARIYAGCLNAFIKVMEEHDTEAMLQLFYDTGAGRYFLHCPKQEAGFAQVYAERDYWMEQKYALVMDIHSHGRINCSFSRTDDEDEQGTRFYCVFYDLAGAASCDIRCGCAGTFLPVPKNALFAAS